MNEFELKDKLVNICDTLSDLSGSLYQNGVENGKLDTIREEANRALERAFEIIQEQIYQIY